MEHKKEVVLLGLLLAAVYAPVTLLHYTFGADAASQTLPWRMFMSDCFHQGVFPYWCPYQYLGYPFFADPQSGLFYPPTILEALLPYGLWTLNYSFLFHVWIGASGMLYWLRSLGFERWSAFAFAVVYGCCGPFAAHATHDNILHSLAWLPWLFFAIRRLFYRPDNISVLLLAVVVYLHLSGGYMGVNFLLCYAAGAWATICFLQVMMRQTIAWKDFVLTVSKALLLIMGAGAGMVYALWCGLPYMSRTAGVSVEAANSYPTTAASWLTFVLGMIADAKSWPFHADYTMRNVFVGWLTTCFLLPGFFGRKGFRWMMLAVVFFMLMALGAATPIRSWVYQGLPLMNLSRHAGIARIFSVFFLITIAAEGFRVAVEGNYSKWWRLSFLFIAVLMPLVVLVLVVHEGGELPAYLLLHPATLMKWIQQEVLVNALMPALLLLVVVGLLLLLVNVIPLFKARQRELILMVMMLEVGIVAHFTIYTSLNTDVSFKAINQVLERYPGSFPIPENKFIGQTHQWTEDVLHPVVWQGAGFFERKIPFDGYNGFMLKSAEAMMRLPNYQQILDSTPLFYPATLKLVGFEPNYWRFQVADSAPSVLRLSQHYFPGWKARCNGKLLTVQSDALQLLEVKGIQGRDVEIYFENRTVLFLWWLSLLVFSATLIQLLKMIFATARSFPKSVEERTV